MINLDDYIDYRASDYIFYETTNFSAGDVVVVARKIPNRFGGWGNFWNTNMDRYLGKIFVVRVMLSAFGENRGMYIEDPHQRTYAFPAYALDRLERR